MPQSSSTRPAHCAATVSGTAISSSRPRSTWSKSAPTCLAVTPEEPSAPMITFAATSVPSASRAVACPSAWSIARTWVRCLSRAPFSSARFSSAASNSSRTTIASSGSPCERVNSCPPRSVMVARRISSRAGTSIRPPAAARDAPIRPPPHVLYRGCSARSSTIVRAPAAAEALAAASPAGPAPTTATSHTSRSCTPSSLGDRQGPGRRPAHRPHLAARRRRARRRPSGLATAGARRPWPGWPLEP